MFRESIINMFIILLIILVIIIYIVYTDLIKNNKVINISNLIDYIKKIINGPTINTISNVSNTEIKDEINNDNTKNSKIKNKTVDDEELSLDNETVDNISEESKVNKKNKDLSSLFDDESTKNVDFVLDTESNLSGNSLISAITIQNPKVFLEFKSATEKLGIIEIELFEDVAPRTVKNFLAFIDGYEGNSYKNCNVHRIIPKFMIQMGDILRGDGSGSISIYGNQFEDETFELKHDGPGLLSMANSGPDTNGSQFFITLDYCPHLDDKHVVFGKVIKGMDVAKKIEKFGTQDGKPKGKVKILNCGRI